MNTLHIQNISKTYPNGTKALNDVSLTIENGMFGLLGANGAGKSSLMRTIATLQSPTSGRIQFNECDIHQNPDIIRKGLGYLPQEFGVYPKLTAVELLHHIGVLKGLLNKKERSQQIESLLHQTNLWEHRKKHVHTYSGGMRQRFGIAQALLGDPKIIIVDEPTAGLDPEERHRFLNMLSKIGENIIVILSTHIVADIYNLCSSMAILDRGSILIHGNPSDLVESLDGQIWRKTIPSDDLPHYRENYDVISTRLVAGETQIHIKAEHVPDIDFEAVPPNLEDYYFSIVPKSEQQTMGLS
ncbi:ABC transporter ATP-binding protein [Gracilimonas sp.]|uniref:ABC transporter ATP-binding protein n=1 Tax=Gracilimonas sp. TaxID=1974203 RepID=UPI0032EECF12